MKHFMTYDIIADTNGKELNDTRKYHEVMYGEHLLMKLIYLCHLWGSTPRLLSL
jgi:hypothetical protein